MSKFALHIRRYSSAAAVLMLAGSFFSAHAEETPSSALAVVGTWRGSLTRDGEVRLSFAETDIPAAIVVVDVTQMLDRGLEQGDALLSVCPHRRRRSLASTLQPSVRRLVLPKSTLATVTLCLTSQDPLRPAGLVKVSTTAAAPALLDKEVEEMEIEPDNKSLVCSGEDDHSDSLSCATPVTVPGVGSGHIGSAWGDDTDMFSFELTERSLLVVQSSGADTIGGLLDASGELLAVDDDGGPGKGFRLVRALFPGRYAIQVEGSAGAEGAFSFTLEARPW